MRLTARAPGKVNLCLFLGPLRTDGRHEVVTLLESVSVADEVTVESVAGGTSVAGESAVGGTSVAVEPTSGPAPIDEVVCAGIPQPNIVTRTLDGLRERGWDGPPLRVVIRKRVPVAAGMGGGSADAAAMLRLAGAIAPLPRDVAVDLAAALGADVPSQLVPGLALGTGAGEVVERVDPLGPHAFVIVPQQFGLSTAEVYRAADRLGLPRDASDLADRLRDLRAGTEPSLVNDLEPAAISLRPEIGRALDAVRDTGAAHAMVSGSGPTVFGIFHGPDAPALAQAAAGDLAGRYPGAACASPVSEEFGAPRGS